MSHIPQSGGSSSGGSPSGGPPFGNPHAYRAHAAFLAPARARSEWWRTGLGVGLTLVAGIALYQLALAFLASLAGPDTMRALLDEATFYGDTPRATLLVLFTYAFFGTGLAMALNALHGRGLASLIGPWEAALSDFLRTILAVGAVLLGVTLLLPQGYDLVRNAQMATGLWLALLPLSIAAIAVQAGTEELFFRGYLQQQIGARMPGWPAWMAVPATLFGLAHWAPDAAGGNAVWFLVWATAFGFAAADLTARTGTLGAAFGLHFANNAVAILGMSLAGPGSGLALWHVPMTADAAALAPLIPVEIATLFVAWLAARLALKV